MLALSFTLLLAVPQALAIPVVVRPLQAASSTTSSGFPCFGYNNVDDSYIPRIVSGLRIALIQPVLTATPYSPETRSFYAFYAKESGVTTNVTTDLNLLSTNVSSGYAYNQGWGLSYGTYLFFNSIFAVSCGLHLGKNVRVLSDMDVAKGALFDPQNQSSRFDVVVLPFSEYVEASEYLAYEEFVAGGGTLVMMAHSLQYPVTYNSTTNVETFVYGHGWAFNGNYAYPIACGTDTYIATCPWAGNNTDWIGGNSCEASCFHIYKYQGAVVNTSDPMGKALAMEFGGTVFRSYVSHEEDTVTNRSHTSVVAVFVNDSTNFIASYTHQFRKGTVVNFGFFGDDIVQTDPSAQYFMLQGMLVGRGGPGSAGANSTSPSASSTAALASSTTSPASSTSAIASSATTPSGPTTVGSTLGLTPTMAASSKSPGSIPSVLVALGGLAVVVIFTGTVALRRRQAKLGG